MTSPDFLPNLIRDFQTVCQSRVNRHIPVKTNQWDYLGNDSISAVVGMIACLTVIFNTFLLLSVLVSGS